MQRNILFTAHLNAADMIERTGLKGVGLDFRKEMTFLDKRYLLFLPAAGKGFEETRAQNGNQYDEGFQNMALTSAESRCIRSSLRGSNLAR